MGDTTPTTRPALAWGVTTDPGRVRDENEDSYVAEPMVLGIADGMGGHLAGEVASQLAVEIMLRGGPDDEISASTGGRLAGPIAKSVLDYMFTNNVPTPSQP